MIFRTQLFMQLGLFLGIYTTDYDLFSVVVITILLRAFVSGINVLLMIVNFIDCLPELCDRYSVKVLRKKIN